MYRMVVVGTRLNVRKPVCRVVSVQLPKRPRTFSPRDACQLASLLSRRACCRRWTRKHPSSRTGTRGSSSVLVGWDVAGGGATTRRAASLAEVRVTAESRLHYQCASVAGVPTATFFGCLRGARGKAARTPGRRSRRLRALLDASRSSFDVQAQ